MLDHADPIDASERKSNPPPALALRHLLPQTTELIKHHQSPSKTVLKRQISLLSTALLFVAEHRVELSCFPQPTATGCRIEMSSALSLLHALRVVADYRPQQALHRARRPSVQSTVALHMQRAGRRRLSLRASPRPPRGRGGWRNGGGYWIRRPHELDCGE